jgi:phosphatidylinositol phospholipase C delta
MGSKQRIVPELASLMIYTAGVKYRGFSKLVEYKAEEMSRVYPHGTRLTSKNYLPHHFWAMGAQLVALNWQTCGM